MTLRQTRNVLINFSSVVMKADTYSIQSLYCFQGLPSTYMANFYFSIAISSLFLVYIERHVVQMHCRSADTMCFHIFFVLSRELIFLLKFTQYFMFEGPSEILLSLQKWNEGTTRFAAESVLQDPGQNIIKKFSRSFERIVT